MGKKMSYKLYSIILYISVHSLNFIAKTLQFTFFKTNASFHQLSWQHLQNAFCFPASFISRYFALPDLRRNWWWLPSLQLTASLAPENWWFTILVQVRTLSVLVVTSTGKGNNAKYNSSLCTSKLPRFKFTTKNDASVSKIYHQTTSQFAGSYPGSYKLPHFANISTHTTHDPKRREEPFGFKKCSTNKSLLDPSRGNKKTQWYASNSSAEEPNGTIYWRIKQGHLAMRNICAGTQNNKMLEIKTSTIDANVFGNDALSYLGFRPDV